jgi:hypothetical protein
MKYYIVKLTTDRKIIGKVDTWQISGFNGKFERNSGKSINELPNLTPADFILDIDVLNVSPKAQMTDFVSGGNYYCAAFIVSEKVKNIFERNIKGSQSLFTIYPIKLQKGDDVFDYYFVHFIQDSIKIVDYDNSKISMKEQLWLDEYDEDSSIRISPKNSGDLISFRNSKKVMQVIVPEEIVLLDSLSDREILVFNCFYERAIVFSEKLIKLLKAEKVSGIEATEISWLSGANKKSGQL